MGGGVTVQEGGGGRGRGEECVVSTGKRGERVREEQGVNRYLVEAPLDAPTHPAKTQRTIGWPRDECGCHPASPPQSPVQGDRGVFCSVKC